MACNDYIILDSCIYRILQMHFSSLPYYSRLLELFHEVILTSGCILLIARNLKLRMEACCWPHGVIRYDLRHAHFFPADNAPDCAWTALGHTNSANWHGELSALGLH